MQPGKKFRAMVVAGALVLAAGGVAFAVRSACWMTGGGSIFDANGEVVYGGRVTHGFELHCNPRKSDNLQVNDHVSGQSFHLGAVTSVTCLDDPGISPNPPDAFFDTYIGTGTGRCKQPDRPCTARWTFTDGGERGGCLRDTAFIQVTDDATNEIVINIAGDVDCGNHQAHSY
jgi:hypothetical protein